MTIEGKKARRKTRTYNALFLVAARFKGKRTLLDISIRDEHATFGQGARERTRRGKGEWKVVERGKTQNKGRRRVDFPEGRRQKKEVGERSRTGWLAISKWIPLCRHTPVLSSSFFHLPRFSSFFFFPFRSLHFSLSLSLSFIFARGVPPTWWGGSASFLACCSRDEGLGTISSRWIGWKTRRELCPSLRTFLQFLNYRPNKTTNFLSFFFSFFFEYSQ